MKTPRHRLAFPQGSSSKPFPCCRRRIEPLMRSTRPRGATAGNVVDSDPTSTTHTDLCLGHNSILISSALGMHLHSLTATCSVHSLPSYMTTLLSGPSTSSRGPEHIGTHHLGTRHKLNGVKYGPSHQETGAGLGRG
jgi:hypothetical protein